MLEPLLREKVVVITGAGRGNGKALADGLSGHGGSVLRLDLTHAPNEFGGRMFKVDINDYAQVEEFIGTVTREFGRIDVLVNNAGVSCQSSDPYRDAEVRTRTMNTNLFSTINFTNEVLRIMARNGSGSIINITSLGAERAFSQNPFYQISKAGLRQYTKAIAKDFAVHNIRANNLCPGYIHTQMTNASYSDPSARQLRSHMTLMKRWGDPSDLVGPAVFLASDMSRYVTGIDLYVDGGWMANSGI